MPVVPSLPATVVYPCMCSGQCPVHGWAVGDGAAASPQGRQGLHAGADARGAVPHHWTRVSMRQLQPGACNCSYSSQHDATLSCTAEQEPSAACLLLRIFQRCCFCSSAWCLHASPRAHSYVYARCIPAVCMLLCKCICTGRRVQANEIPPAHATGDIAHAASMVCVPRTMCKVHLACVIMSV
jgi:hypothetical protein